MSIFDILKNIESERKKRNVEINGETVLNNEYKIKQIEWIICGLGNPGTRYENTRHNAGFMALDNLSEKLNVKINKLKFKSLTGEATVNGTKCFLMKPTTYMNLSGEALREAMSFYKLSPERVIVIFDDITQEVGTIRIRRNGSDGGHNGMKNIIYLTGSDMFPRIKIGVGGKPHPDYNLADWVTGPFKKEEGEALKNALDKAVGALDYMVRNDFETAMNKYNGKK